jgi:lipid-A-disaccharide synthase
MDYRTVKGTKKVLIVAGEASGDLHGGNLVREMRMLRPELEFSGIGGKKMEAAGVRLIADVADMAVVGLTEVIGKLGAVLFVMRKVKAMLKEDPPALLILIDYPDFNLPLARAAHRQGIKVMYYISPQVWAWRKGRVNAIRKNVDKMVVILPFESEFYRKEGVDATFVGHPLLDAVQTSYTRPEALARNGLKDETVTVAILPGSRRGEVEKLLPEMLEACRIIADRVSPVQFVLPLAPTLALSFVENIIRRYDVPVRIVEKDLYEAIAVSDAAIVASGTATLETALLGAPMVVIYKISPLSYAVGKRFIKVDHISLVNLIAGREVVPELIQQEATPDRIAAGVRELIVNEKVSQKMRDSYAELRGKLGTPGASRRTAGIACGML